MLKRHMLASLVAGLAFAAQAAAASDLWYYPGHGWLPQPPLTWTSGQQHGSAIAGPASALAGTQPRAATTPYGDASSRIAVPAPYDAPGGYFN